MSNPDFLQCIVVNICEIFSKCMHLVAKIESVLSMVCTRTFESWQK